MWIFFLLSLLGCETPCPSFALNKSNPFPLTYLLTSLLLFLNLLFIAQDGQSTANNTAAHFAANLKPKWQTIRTRSRTRRTSLPITRRSPLIHRKASQLTTLNLDPEQHSSTPVPLLESLRSTVITFCSDMAL